MTLSMYWTYTLKNEKTERWMGMEDVSLKLVIYIYIYIFGYFG